MNDFYTHLNFSIVHSPMKQKRENNFLPKNFNSAKHKSQSNQNLCSSSQPPIKNSLQSLLFKPKYSKDIKLKSDPSYSSLNMKDYMKHKVSIMQNKNREKQSFTTQKQKSQSNSVIDNFPTMKIQQIDFPQQKYMNYKAGHLIGLNKVRLQKLRQNLNEQKSVDNFMNFIQPQIPKQRKSHKIKSQFQIVQRDNSSQTLPHQNNNQKLQEEENPEIYFFPKQYKKKIIHSNLYNNLQISQYHKQINQGHFINRYLENEDEDIIMQIHSKMS